MAFSSLIHYYHRRRNKSMILKKLKQIWDIMNEQERLESDVGRKFRERLKELPFRVAAKKMLGGSNNINEADWFVCVLGRLLLIETKKPVAEGRKAKEARAGQLIRAKWWKRAGAKYVVVDNEDGMIEAIQELYREQRSLIDKEGENVY